jgi:hypothetical protein
MAMTRVQLRYTINPKTGRVVQHAPVGVVGPACRTVTAPFEARFAGTKVDVPTPELDVAVEAEARVDVGEA